jgi:hypothetical protein
MLIFDSVDDFFSHQTPSPVLLKYHMTSNADHTKRFEGVEQLDTSAHEYKHVSECESHTMSLSMTSTTLSTQTQAQT